MGGVRDEAALLGGGVVEALEVSAAAIIGSNGVMPMPPATNR
ncbi:hypothetical protein SBI_10002 [Streptomyces bingchenggensis BCW-1]|uniref:Uncharacterized protein n=1 Tax=Streptomyces bingchenggensis (strain BCW-1) TaxID=749414 RepID=D7CFA4_STRBB|nr:hypothetical protein SBI_10002 [Streptomyces bingchenggensis BCW-1]